MESFVTGATGFIGRHLIPHLLARGQRVHVLVRRGSLARLEALRPRWGAGAERVHAVVGDLAEPRLGVADPDVEALRGRIDHFFHLAALYDMEADADSLREANVDGTRHMLELAEEMGAGCVHHVSSIAAAGRYPGTFREDMFDEAEGLDDPYFATKHESEGLVRSACAGPWRVYRPGIVVGHSVTGEIDKIDGPYYFFRLLRRLGVLPSWLPLVGIEGAPMPLVPVDFVARALDVLAHERGLDGRCFHLVDPRSKPLGEVLNLFAKAAGAPRFGVKLDARTAGLLSAPLRGALRVLPGAQRVGNLALAQLGIPPRVLAYVNPPRFDCRQAKAVLDRHGVRAPELESYAGRLYEYWARHLDPDAHDPALARALGGKRVLITGASSGIGRATALRAAAAGAEVLLGARAADKLVEVKREIERAGGSAHVYSADVADLGSCDALVKEVLNAHGGIDVLVNNAGRSIRRSLALSQERFHDYQRTMQLNYFGALRLVFGFLPAMRAQRFGHIVNVSSIGVQAHPPRFSAYVASKAALDAFSRVAASELLDDDVRITTVYMPLVRTEMIAPTTIYKAFPTISAEQAADLLCDAFIGRGKRVATPLGVFGELAYAAAPQLVDRVLAQAYKLFPDSAAARGKPADSRGPAEEPALTPRAVAFAHLVPGVHW
jgi:NAD(P)-dependent dehydrogenase (short-subunit alcohol dehydrogenase family)